MRNHSFSTLTVHIYRILNEWSFHMKFKKRDFGEFHELHMKWPRVIWSFQNEFHCLELWRVFNRKCMVDMDVVMTLLVPTKVLLHVWSYDIYDTTLSTAYQLRHMIFFLYKSIRFRVASGLRVKLASCNSALNPLPSRRFTLLTVLRRWSRCWSYSVALWVILRGD